MGHLQEIRNIITVFFFGYTVQLTEKYVEAKNYTAVIVKEDEYYAGGSL